MLVSHRCVSLLVRVWALDVWGELVPSKICNPPFPVLEAGHSVSYSCMHVCDVCRDWVNEVGFFLVFLFGYSVRAMHVFHVHVHTIYMYMILGNRVWVVLPKVLYCLWTMNFIPIQQLRHAYGTCTCKSIAIRDTGCLWRLHVTLPKQLSCRLPGLLCAPHFYAPASDFHAHVYLCVLCMLVSHRCVSLLVRVWALDVWGPLDSVSHSCIHVYVMFVGSGLMRWVSFYSFWNSCFYAHVLHAHNIHLHTLLLCTCMYIMQWCIVLHGDKENYTAK